jgi:micrococcal nuclease
MDALLLCVVVAITDGDTLRARCGDAPELTIRLAGIDAPEKRQAFGERSHQYLAGLCLKKPAEIETKGKDRFGRTLAHVRCEGTDANAEQVRAGMAWAFTRYLTDPSIKSIENDAKSAGRGLWADPTPMAPWEWRQSPPRL